ncbi:hypothetical protein PHLGIDRAFT_501020 [Phlebiopsis gigantea 11061_1 CR5-6]|uniref:Uncharacterized protein n=1 Tax=Phlebiopsis gigantea (strain 11061_1 CR5-6) TaxID=745531 RepID=A0A0C3NDJ5_PHLG1|nr:hypothetical protein PHLGIDRAFT_501020 [Phlebiopsis gigantea 11061_1 CR5-6]
MAVPDAAPITSFSAPSGLHFDTTIGIYVISPIVNAVLYGTLCLQVYNFFQKFKDEGPLLKYSVVAVWPISSSYDYLFTEAITRVLRLRSYKHGSAIVFGCILVIIATMCISLVHNGRLYTLHTVPNFSKQVGLYFAELGAFVVSDFYIAVSLCYLLYKQRKHTRPGFSRVYLLLSECFRLLGSHTVPTAYSNCLMASLNARSAFRNEPQIVSIPLATRNGLALHSSRDDDETVAVEQESSVTGTEGKGKGTLNL